MMATVGLSVIIVLMTGGLAVLAGDLQLLVQKEVSSCLSLSLGSLADPLAKGFIIADDYKKYFRDVTFRS